MNERNYFLPSIGAASSINNSNTINNENSGMQSMPLINNNNNNGAKSTSTTSLAPIIMFNQQQKRQSKIPILYAPSRSIQEYLTPGAVQPPSQNYRFNSMSEQQIHHLEPLNTNGFNETPPNSIPNYTDKWKFQHVIL